MIKIKVNGNDWQVAAGTTVANLISHHKILPKLCVVEKNGEIITRENFYCTILQAEDQIEIIRFMAGG